MFTSRPLHWNFVNWKVTRVVGPSWSSFFMLVIFENHLISLWLGPPSCSPDKDYPWWSPFGPHIALLVDPNDIRQQNKTNKQEINKLGCFWFPKQFLFRLIWFQKSGHLEFHKRILVIEMIKIGFFPNLVSILRSPSILLSYQATGWFIVKV